MAAASGLLLPPSLLAVKESTSVGAPLELTILTLTATLYWLWVNGKAVFAPTTELHVHDRVGGGDGFASGFIYGLLNGETAEEAIRLGWAHGALMTTFPGDTTMATVDQVRAFASGGSARIQR